MDMSMQNFPSRCIRKEKMLNKALKKYGTSCKSKGMTRRKGGRGKPPRCLWELLHFPAPLALAGSVAMGGTRLWGGQLLHSESGKSLGQRKRKQRQGWFLHLGPIASPQQIPACRPLPRKALPQTPSVLFVECPCASCTAQIAWQVVHLLRP